MKGRISGCSCHVRTLSGKWYRSKPRVTVGIGKATIALNPWYMASIQFDRKGGTRKVCAGEGVGRSSDSRSLTTANSGFPLIEF